MENVALIKNQCGMLCGSSSVAAPQWQLLSGISKFGES